MKEIKFTSVKVNGAVAEYATNVLGLSDISVDVQHIGGTNVYAHISGVDAEGEQVEHDYKIPHIELVLFAIQR